MFVDKCTIELIDAMGNDLTVVNAARVSFNKLVRELLPSDERLINYLASNNHWTPFSQVILQFRMSMPIFMARQWFKHQVGFTRNEVSRRYVDDEPSFYMPTELRTRPSKSIKQGSGGVHPASEFFKGALAVSYNEQLKLYNHMIGEGVAPEQARIVLPQSMMTEWIETSSLAGYARACKLRSDTHAQREWTLPIAEIADLCETVAPRSWNALMGDKS